MLQVLRAVRLVFVSCVALSWAVADGDQRYLAPSIRVLLDSAPRVDIGVTTGYQVLADRSVLLQASQATDWQLSVSSSGIVVRGVTGVLETKRECLRLSAGGDPGARFVFAQRTYRGEAVICVRRSQLEIVNQLDLESYLRGVVALEMPVSWPEEALRAQAIIARTYALSLLTQASAQIQQVQQRGYDLCATSLCQVYGGASAETARSDAAVAQTTGLVAVDEKRQVAQTVFHADSGGYTASSDEVWGKAVPYLVAQVDPFSSANPPWQVVPKAVAIEAMLKRFAPKIGALKELRVRSRSASGRILSLELQGTVQSLELDGPRARDFIRGLGVPSTLAEVSSSTPLTLRGRGSGHGVGLSQWGARSLAMAGWGFGEILAYYYPGIALAELGRDPKF